MKRTGEITLSIIGAVTALIGIVLFTALKKVFLMEDVVNEILIDFNEELIETGNETLDGATFIAGMSVYFNIIAILFSTALIIGIIAAILFRNNNKPKVASILLIITAVVVTVGTIGLGLITGILLLIPGIMGLVRKPKVELTDTTEFSSFDDEDDDNPYRSL